MRAVLSLLRSGRADKFYALGSTGAIALSRMLYAAILARLVTPDEFAIFIVLITIEIWAQTGLGARYVTPLMTYAPSLEPAGRDALLRFVARAIARVTGWTVLAAALLTPLATWFGLSPMIYLGFVAYLGGWLLHKGLAGCMAAAFRRGTSFVGDLIRLPLPLLGFAASHAVGIDPLATFFWLAGVGCAISSLLMVRALPVVERDEVGDDVRRQVRRRGWAAFVGSLANSTCSRTQPFVLGLTGDLLATAQFGAANTLMGPIRLAGGALADILQPRLALYRNAPDGAARSRRILLLCSVALGAIMLGVYVVSLAAGEWVATLAFGEQYADLGAVLPWACAFVAVATAVSIAVIVMQVRSVELTAHASRLRVVVAIGSLLVIWPACAWAGVRGAFTAMLMAESVYLALAVSSLLADRVDASVALGPSSTTSAT